MSEKREVAPRTEERHSPALMPPIDVLEDETGITLFADLPGVPRDRLTVRLDGDGLLIEGEIAVETPEGTTPAYIGGPDAALPAGVHPEPRAGYHEERGRVQGRGAEAPHPQGRARPAAPDPSQRRLTIGSVFISALIPRPLTGARESFVHRPLESDAPCSSIGSAGVCGWPAFYRITPPHRFGRTPPCCV